MERSRRPLTQIDNKNTTDMEQRKCRKRPNLDELPGPSRKSSKCLQKRPGTVINMVLKNFMCHTHLEVSLENNINYIVGRNGSGKSAILTALVIGLGGKASLTNRGTSIKGFIKAGTNAGSVQITLLNKGPFAYQSSTYGDSIVIQRNFASSGQSNYTIRSATGTLISKQAREIQRITSGLNIQIDNPVCVLNQDTSRNFLSTSDVKLRFQLFMRATRLELLQESLLHIRNNRKTSKRLFREKEALLEERRAIYEDLKRKLVQLETIGAMKDTYLALQVELLWSQVQDLEEEERGKEEEVEEKRRGYEELLDMSGNRRSRVEEVQEKVNEINQQIAELKDAAVVQNRPRVDCINIIEQLTKQLDRKQREKQNFLRVIGSKENESRILSANMKAITESMTTKEQENLERQRQINLFEEKLVQVANLLQTTENEQFQFDNEAHRKDDDLRAIRQQLADINTEQRKEEERLQSVNDSQGNKLALYGGHMPRLVELLKQNANRFQKQPIGPIGSYISVKDPKWSVAIESHIARLMGGFLIDNKQDNKTFLEIFRKNFPRLKDPDVITGVFRTAVPNISTHKVLSPDDCVSIFDAISVSDVNVLCTLLDKSYIESTLLIPSGQRAMDLLSNAHSVPKNCVLGLTIKGDKFYPDPKYKSYGSTYHQVRYLQVDSTEMIRNCEQRLQQLDASKTSINQQFNQLNEDVRKRRATTNEARDKIEKLKTHQIILRKKLQSLNVEIEPETFNVQNMETELEEIKHAIIAKQAEIQNVDGELEDLQRQLSVQNETLNKLKSSGKGIEERIAPLEREIREQMNKKEELVVSVSFDKRRLVEGQQRLERAKDELHEKKMEVQSLINQANSIGERPEKLRNVQQVATRLKDIQRTIQQAEVNTDDPVELSEKTKNNQASIVDLTELLTAIDEDIQLMNTSFEERVKLFHVHQDYFVNMIDYSFQKVLETRQFKGSLKVDMKEKELDMVVVPQQGSQGLTTTANLSGGERSFSTVAFLYSLWQCMDFPFYFLDEFDVYMDKVNRNTVMEILIQNARSRPDLQYVFLTPQDISFIHDDDIAVHKLDDPERRARTQ